MKTEAFLNHKVSSITGVVPKEGNVFGVELELEGRNVGLQDVAVRGWQRHADGSLRGESVEYTTAGAKKIDLVKKDVENLFTKFKENKVQFNDSIRTSTHVHLNFSDKPFKQAVNFYALFTLLEEVLQYYSGEDRKGNLFCISSREAEGIVGVLVDAIGKCDLSRFAGDRYKYAACNLSTLYKFGTIEVRTMRGATSAKQVNTWLDILNELLLYSVNMTGPADLIGRLSLLGAEGLMKEIFTPDSYRELRASFPLVQDLDQSLMDGARLLQVFAYQFHDDFVKVVEVKEAPEGQLPRRRADGVSYIIFKPDGNSWVVHGTRRTPFFQHGEELSDDARITWDEEVGRFVVHYPGGEVVPCRWRDHPAIGNEGAPRPIRHMPPHPEEDEEPNWGEDGDIIDMMEGDEF